MGEVVCVLGAVVSAVVAMLAAGPLCWQHEPFNAQLNPIGGMVGSLPTQPPIGLTCAISNFARNSPVITSNIEFVSLELQRFLGISKSDRIKLRATFVGEVGVTVSWGADSWVGHRRRESWA